MNNQNPIEIYQAQDGTTQVEVRFENDTVWLSQAQMAMLFGKIFALSMSTLPIYLMTKNLRKNQLSGNSG